LFLDDLAQVLYAPTKAFQKIVQNPKYLGVLLVFALFVGLIVGFEFVQFSKIYVENTNPEVGNFQAYLNSTVWRSSSNITLTNNYADPFNYSIFVAALGTNYSVFGNSSLEMHAKNANSITAALGNQFAVNCNATSGFQNFTLTIKQVEPAVAPKAATLTLYSTADTNFYTYDLTSSLSHIVSNWNSLIIPVGPKASGWTSTGQPTWNNITALQLSLNYPTNSNITLRVGALFFRGLYQTPVQSSSLGLLEQFLPSWAFWFILAWIVLTGIIYVSFYALKTTRIWKPIFVAIGSALIVLVVRAAVSLIAAAALPVLYYPYDVTLGIRFNLFGATTYAGNAGSLTALSQNALNNINSATGSFGNVVFIMAIISYVWLGALAAIVVGSLKPEFSTPKRIAIALVGVVVMLFALLLLIGFI